MYYNNLNSTCKDKKIRHTFVFSKNIEYGTIRQNETYQ